MMALSPFRTFLAWKACGAGIATGPPVRHRRKGIVMRKIDRLIKEGKESAAFRGHKMKRTHYGHDSSGCLTAVYECEKCQRTFYVTDKPMPNEAELRGSALAVECGAKG